MKKLEYNINNDVFIKLNDLGFDILVKDHNKYSYLSKMEPVTVDYFKERVDDDGFYPIQLWELMNIFGKSIYNGCKMPFEPTILITSNEI